VIWALTDVLSGTYRSGTLLDPRAPADGLRRLDRGRGGQDARIRRALREVFAKGRVPLPDRLLAADGRVDTDCLALDFDGNRLLRLDDGCYRLELDDPARGLGCSLLFAPEKPAIRHGDDGIVCTGTDVEMFYYFVPRCRVQGTLRLEGAPVAVRSGSGWYDHEFGRSESRAEEESGPTGSGQAWNWIAAQLDDGSDITVFVVVDTQDGDRVLESRAIVVDPEGRRREYTEFAFEPLEAWTSCRTFNEYPTRWRLEVPEAGARLTVESEFAAQEFVTLISPPSFWEGRVRVHGSLGGRQVTGLGYVERTGFCKVESLDEFFSAVGRETRRCLDRLVPAAPTPEQARRAVGSDRRPSHLDGLDVEQYVRTVLEPIRYVVHNGGKAWRSFGFLACFDAAGGDAEAFREWLALPELVHVGSLIVDDVQDQSELRRGSLACHRVYGEPLAINAGTACYFLAELILANTRLSDRKLARSYELYFEAMRAAHAGQALDIDGPHRLMADAVESGDGTLLERQVLAVHRLKSAVPPASLARVAALLSDASSEVEEALAGLFESYGVAFQIVDDVLNLRGFEGDTKTRGEDIREGKVTAPVARAMSLLSPEERRRLWCILQARTSDPAVIADAIALLEGCGALTACERQARELVEGAWPVVDERLPDSHAKVKLRAFGWFILDRHY
jgi:geranylgeranyl pyrophosphate synthase